MFNLIIPSVLKRFEDIAANVKTERVNTFIKKAQELDLKSFLGYALYYELIKNLEGDGQLRNDAPEHYKNLLNGCEYLDDQGYIVLYQGLLPVISYFTFARFIEADAVHYTATGPIIKRQENADNLTAKDLTKLIQQHRSTANAYANDAERFLLDHGNDFPAWNYNHRNKISRQPGPRIRAVDITEFNYAEGDILGSLTTQFYN